MARIRSIKPEFWSSPNLPADPWTRLLYIAMWNWADDAGVGTANLRELAGFAFPNDEHIDTGAMRRMCADIAAHFGAQFYEVDGRPYYAIPSWQDHQKFDNRRGGKHPTPDAAEKPAYQGEHVEPAQCADMSAQSRRTPGAGTGEQGNLGTGEQAVVTREPEKANSSDKGASDDVPLPPEPDPDDWTETGNVIALDTPRHIETGSAPKKPQPTNAARTTVAQVIPGLTRQVVNQLAVHVAQAARDGTPDKAIRAGLERWRDDPGKVNPGALPYRIGDAARDLAAQTSNTPARPSKQRSMAEMLAQARADEAHQKAVGELE